MVSPIPPGSSNYHFNLSSSINENINSLIQMLNGSFLSYEKESCQKLFQPIVKTFPQLEHLSKIIENPSAFEPNAIQEAIQQLKECL